MGTGDSWGKYALLGEGGGGGGHTVAACKCLKKVIPPPGWGLPRCSEEKWDSVHVEGTFKEIIGVWDPQTLPGDCRADHPACQLYAAERAASRPTGGRGEVH